MKYIITKHAQQRRKWHKIRSKENLIALAKMFDEKLNMKSLKDGVYRVLKGPNAFVFAKDRDKCVVISVRGFWNIEVSKNIEYEAVYKRELRR